MFLQATGVDCVLLEIVARSGGLRGSADKSDRELVLKVLEVPSEATITVVHELCGLLVDGGIFDQNNILVHWCSLEVGIGRTGALAEFVLRRPA